MGFVKSGVASLGCIRQSMCCPLMRQGASNRLPSDKRAPTSSVNGKVSEKLICCQPLVRVACVGMLCGSVITIGRLPVPEIALF